MERIIMPMFVIEDIKIIGRGDSGIGKHSEKGR